ncbi:cobyrinate a,c-diamide synthase [Schnuerera sp. xch1]|uniref:cobyrinate a,c-diamide synthase n=1 Tax=Schnuerera sp. xch1 TaxID=2874283 RepID=UPI001CBB6870|nr:cobyrinate a,c-diamide synthase [Schnuerera sp. xch1]MBZ2175523.1 cobyrinate a,c-diamide synthase [Schnuerera sp. xch1]
MRTLMITAPSSNSGKTILTTGIIRAIKNRGLDIGAFKTGPDFIDTRYLGLASGKRAGNLDMHLMGKEGLRSSLSMNNSEYGIIEGAMGYFDGIHNTYENSSFHMSKKLNIPSVLVYTPKGEMFSAIPKIKGMVDFSNGLIKGIILNKVTEPIYTMMKEIIEEHINIEVLGYVPYNDSLEIESRYLGLMQYDEISNTEELIDRSSRLIEETLDIDRMINIMEEVETKPYEYPMRRDINIAIAYDKAFNFYYGENLNLFENICNVEYFSPLKDRTIPDSDLIFIGGGYPELFKEELSSNRSMINSIRDNAMKGKHIIGEAGGFMYLVSSIEGYPMCNIFNGQARMTDRLQRFGYANIELAKDTIFGKEGSIITGNEYHNSTIDIDGTPLFNISKLKSSRKYQCGYAFKNVLGYYQHINFLGNMESFNYLLNKIENYRKER